MYRAHDRLIPMPKRAVARSYTTYWATIGEVARPRTRKGTYLLCRFRKR